MTLVDEVAAAFTCPECGATSYHPEDLKRGYCARCRWFTGDTELWLGWAPARRARELGPRLATEPKQCHDVRCSALEILVAPAVGVDPADATAFWWCPGCRWSGLAVAPRRYSAIYDPGDGVRAERWVRPGRCPA
ncbi:hypothetical protein [Streptomyces sp. NPDC049879]|uniref:hypothetical protein n=1 Tax=Streptomyces sp. NPDC049879 TaxID=3365598 RepID=UPI0037B562AF